MQQQYSQYQASDGRRLNSTATLTENIVDNGGLETMYRAFRMNPGSGLALPELGLSSDQLFFLASAGHARAHAPLARSQYAPRL